MLKRVTLQISRIVKQSTEDPVAVEATLRTLKNVFEQYVKLNKRIPPELLMSLAQ